MEEFIRRRGPTANKAASEPKVSCDSKTTTYFKLYCSSFNITVCINTITMITTIQQHVTNAFSPFGQAKVSIIGQSGLSLNLEASQIKSVA